MVQQNLVLIFLKLIYILMINQSDQASNQYGFYAVPKALEPKKKYRQTFEEESKYSDQQAEEQNQFQTIDRQQQNEKDLQRDFYVDEAPYPEFKPKQRGLDYGVQIQRHELFDYELEVQPLIEILVGRSVVSAINQLQEEKERGERQVALDHYQKKRNAQLMLTQRLQTKHNRKQDQAKRRVLQKQTYVKNKKIATQKLISRKNAKHDLLGLRNEVLNQLQQEGFLRQSTYLSLRVQYESWLYEQIKSIVNQHKKVEQTANNLIKQKEKEIKNQHQKFIQKQNKRRKDILDERERVRKQNQQRKLKKKIRKQRLNLNAERTVKHDQLAEQLQKHEAVQKILKAQSLSNGLTKRKNAGGTVHIAGGLLNYVLAMINASGNHSPAQIQAILQKLLNELSSKLEIDIPAAHIAKIEQMKAKMEADPIQFMTYKQNMIQQLTQQISLDISVLQAAGISLKSQVHSSILTALMNIYLNSLPGPKMEGDEIVGAYQPTEKDKKRQQLKAKVELVPTQTGNHQQIKKSENVLRVRFQKVKPEPSQPKQNQQQAPKQEQPQQKPVDLDEWIDIYDGENWEKKKKQEHKEIQRETQQASSYALNGFANTFVMDERNLHYLQAELQKLLGIQGGEQLIHYKDRLEYLVKASDKIPIYDIELQWE